MRRDFRSEGGIHKCFEDYEDFEEYAEIEEYEERRNTDGEHPPFFERVISRSNEYISSGKLSRNYEGKELCERCGAVKKPSAVRRSQPRQRPRL